MRTPDAINQDNDDTHIYPDEEGYEQEMRPARKKAQKPKEPNLDELREPGDDGGIFQTTYTPSRHEAEWLLSSLRTFYDQQLLTDVLAQMKGGKEASVYRCTAHPDLQTELIAAKVYRPRKFRSLRNDKMYQQGREILNSEGRVVKKSDERIMKAIGKKTEFGEAVAHTSWLMYEYTTLQRLYAAGAAVPKPYAAGENAILMEYYGNRDIAAPTLIEVTLEEGEAAPLLTEILRNIELMYRLGMIHGDLSAYNILYWGGRITLIDFPQVTNRDSNENAAFILERDVRRVCEYFERQGVRSDCDKILARWQ